VADFFKKSALLLEILVSILLMDYYLLGFRLSRKMEESRNKTISNFRKENAKPLKKVFREFVLLCKLIKGFG